MAYFVSSTTDQNYYFEDSIAYTEDHIRVRKLCWCDAPSKLEESTLCSHFAEFGHVLQIQTVRFKMDASMFQSGSVLYANDKDAARALMSTHMLNGVIFMVQPSDSWEQPDAYGTPEEEVNHQGPSPILALNDDCLEHIMAKLGLQDRLRFARSCLRFRAIVQASASLHTSLDLIQFRRLTVWDIRDYFQLFGAHIQTLAGNFETDHSERLAEFIRDYCSSLRSMQVIYNPQLGLHLHTMIANKSQLEELQLSNSDIDDEALFDLQDLNNLRKLNLSRCQLTGCTLDKLPISVEELVLDECPNLRDRYLTDMCLRLPKLRKLSIQNVRKSSFRVFETMVKESSCPSLEVLRITACPYTTFELVPQLPSLKSLTISSSNEFIDGVDEDLKFQVLIAQLVEHKSQQLEHFEVLGFYCLPREELLQVAKLGELRVLHLLHTVLTDDVLKELANLKKLKKLSYTHRSESYSAILHLFRVCPRLSHLRLEYCSQPNASVIRNIVAQVRREIASNENQRKLPIELWSLMDGEHLEMVPKTEFEGILQMKCTAFDFEVSLKNYF